MSRNKNVGEVENTGEDRLDTVEEDGEGEQNRELVNLFNDRRTSGEDEGELVMEYEDQQPEEEADCHRCHHCYCCREFRSFAIPRS